MSQEPKPSEIEQLRMDVELLAWYIREMNELNLRYGRPYVSDSERLGELAERKFIAEMIEAVREWRRMNGEDCGTTETSKEGV